MILHASICFFNGEEFLEACIRNLENVVDHVTVIWQEKSYRGNPISQEALDILHQLDVDKILYCNNSESGHSGVQCGLDETEKRNLGLDAARKLGATHHMDMDVDEFYFPQQLQYAKELVAENDLDSTACRLYEYHGDIHRKCPEWRSDMFVGLIHKVHPETCFINGGEYPVRIDPTRIVNPGDNFYAFDPDEVCMHHYTLVRKHMYQSKIIDCNGGIENVDRLEFLWNDAACYDAVPDYFGIERGI